MNEYVVQNTSRNRGKIFRNYFAMKHSTYQDTGLYQQMHQQFVADNKGDLFFERILVAITKTPTTFKEVIFKVKSYLGDARVVMPREVREVCIQGTYKGHNAFVWIDAREYSE